jgi:hypothetical protein
MMRSYFGMWMVAAVLLFSGSASAQLQMAQPWTAYKPDGGRFSVDMPRIPKETIVPVPTGGGATVPMLEATAVVPGRASYIVSYVDYPASVTKGAAADVILNQVRNGSASGNTVRDEKKVQLGRAEGREYAVVQANGNVAVTRIYWSRGRLFQLVVDGKAGIEKQPETRKFLESFALITPEQR